MGKAAMCIRMLQILNTGRIYKISELSGLLDTNPRNVLEYKKELDEVSDRANRVFCIETIPGRYGGYKLNGNALIPSIKLSSKEKNALTESYKYLLSNESFIKREELINAYAKIMSALFIEDKNLELMTVNKVNVYKANPDIKKWYDLIARSIREKKAILLEYDFLKEPRHVVKVHPYEIFMYDNEWRFFGWSFDTGDVFYYKLSRIKNIEITNERFVVWNQYNPRNYLKDGVFTQNGEMFPVTLIASGVRARLFKEKEYGKDQICEDLPDGRTKVTLEMQKNHSTYNFILGCGNLVEVVEPVWLKEKIIELAKLILQQYNIDI